ncbi:hypothetical protein IFM89_021557 [Coptis chinensis]|uniref:Uncharacterized protein n=1 Tax=Coptis chinensis TaxID=261450 RepID=A0A835IEB8_9MAGN|nr:hypothetical protein IFM89_021557 [Coptis chinensis]
MARSASLDSAKLEDPQHWAYISAARKVSPYVPNDLEEYIASAYSGICQDEPYSAFCGYPLFSKTVAQSDVDEALRLMQMSKFPLYYDDRQKSGLDAILDIYSILRDEAARTNKLDVSYADALNWISRKVKESLCMLEIYRLQFLLLTLSRNGRTGEIKPEGVVIRTSKHFLLRLMPRSLVVDIATAVPTAIVSGNYYSFPHDHYQ